MKRACLIGCFFALLSLIPLSCNQGNPPLLPETRTSGEPEWFEDVTERVGLDFVHDPGPLDGKFFMPQIVGSGAALFDCDGDGRLDLYLLNNGGPSGSRNRLYHQRQDGTFADISAGSGLDVAGYSMGVAVGDIDNDGRPDVLLTQYGGIRLFHNLGGGRFCDVTVKAGLHNPAWATSAAFLDYDRDGWLDLVVANYVDYDSSYPCTTPSGEKDYCTPKTFAGRVSALFHNLGGQGQVGRFADHTLPSGLGRLPGPGLGVVCADFDGDGWTDIFIANDGQPNRLWINQHDGSFHDEAVPRGVAYNGMGHAWAGMGVVCADLDGDGLHDLFVTHLRGETNNLWRQEPRGFFFDRTGTAGLASPRWRGTGFGVVAADFDQDGWLDLAVANGDVARTASSSKALGTHWSGYAQRNQLFAAVGEGRFRDASLCSPVLCGVANVARGLAVGDVDGDGSLDLLVSSAGGRVRLLRNVAPSRGHWLLVRCMEGRRDVPGAEVKVQGGGRSWLRRADAGGSYLCASDPRAHFGLGVVEEIEFVEVRWPDGVRERFSGGGVDREMVLSRGKGQRVENGE